MITPLVSAIIVQQMRNRRKRSNEDEDIDIDLIMAVGKSFFISGVVFLAILLVMFIIVFFI